MAIPGSVLNSQFPFGIAAANDMYPSVATLRPVTRTTDSTGQVIKTFADSTVTGQHGIACRMSPLILIRPQMQEYDRTGVQQVDAKFQVNLNVFINLAVDVLVEWQIKVDGSVYQIKSVESDGNHLTTRFMVSDVLPMGF